MTDGTPSEPRPSEPTPSEPTRSERPPWESAPSDGTPPDATTSEETAAHQHPAASVPGPGPAQPTRRANRWGGRRVSLAVAGAAVLLACLLGAGVTAVGAVVVGELTHRGGSHGAGDGRGDDRGHRDDADRPTNRGDRHTKTPAAMPGATTPAPAGTVTPSPSTS